VVLLQQETPESFKVVGLSYLAMVGLNAKAVPPTSGHRTQRTYRTATVNELIKKIFTMRAAAAALLPLLSRGFQLSPTSPLARVARSSSKLSMTIIDKPYGE